MSDTQNRGGRRFITSSRFDTDETILDDIDSTDTVLPSEGVEGQKDIDGIGMDRTSSGNSDFDGKTFFEFDGEVFGFLGSVFGSGSEFPHIGGRGGVGVLEDTGLVRDVEEVFICGSGCREDSA